MKKQKSENREQGTGAAEPQVEETPKPKAKKKRAAVEAAVETPMEVIAAEPAVEEAKPRKAKAAKVSKAKTVLKEAPVAEVQAEEAPVVAVAEASEPESEQFAELEPAASKIKTFKKKAAAKPKKGRDLVEQVPGAQEVADVMEEVAAEAAAVEQSAHEDAEDLEETVPGPERPEPKLERLQKILAKAGISSRRKAEELILGGRVQINGKVVSELGTKADIARDHVRVDGKLLQGAERIRYFVLNKPKGFVTTVSDPEGRPTVMQFFAGERERLYPVGRLDYLSEGLLLVTNDGDLANKLTKAASGVEKTYLVKVAGEPTEDMLDVLRRGVVIEKGRPGEHTGRVRTAPAQIRKVREGDNPWYEVIIIEGRNRELRKMFEEIGHHVEKIRRVGYGPLVLDLEPGKLRELEAEEVHQLRLAADGKLKAKKKRIPAAAQLPTVAGKTVRYKKGDGKPGFEPRARAPRPEFQQDSKSEMPTYRRAEPGGKLRTGPRPGGRPEGRVEGRTDARPGVRPAVRPGGRPAGPGARPPFREVGRPAAGGFKAGPGAGRPGSFDRGARPAFGAKPRRPEPPVTEIVLPPRKAVADDFDEKPQFNPDFKPGFRTGGAASGKAPFRKAGPGSDKPRFDKPAARKPFQNANDAYEEAPRTGGKIRVEPVEERPRESRPPSRPPAARGFERDQERSGGKPFRPRTEGTAPRGDRPSFGGARSGPPAGRAPGFAGGGKPFRPAGEGRPARAGGGREERPYRPQGDRPAPGGRPFRPRTDGPPSGDRAGRGGAERGEFRPRQAGPRPSGERPAGRSGPRFEGRDAAAGPRSRPGDGDRPRTFKPGAPKKFGAKPGAAAGKTGPDGEPRKKERWRNSFTGKNKGRPKPKS